MGAALRRVYRSDRVFVAAKLPLNDSSHCSMSSFFSSYSAEPPEGYGSTAFGGVQQPPERTVMNLSLDDS